MEEYRSFYEVKLNRKEHSLAKSGGEVFGNIRGISKLHCYVELGEEKPYTGKEKDWKEERRKFISCTVWLYETQEDLDNGDHIAEVTNCTIVIFK